MDFSFTPEQQAIRDAVTQLCARFDAQYWLERDTVADFRTSFYAAMAQAGWLGVAMPQEYGGAGLGITEAALMMQAISESGAGFSGASSVHMNIFGLNPVVVFGNEEQKQRWLPPLIRGEEKACFAVTEPNAGLNTAKLGTTARRDGEPLYLARPEDLDIDRASGEQDADPRAQRAAADASRKPTDGLVACSTPISIAAMSKCARSKRWAARRSTRICLFIEDLPVPASRSPRRGRQRLRLHSARAQSRAHLDCRRSDRTRACRAQARGRPTPTNASCSIGRSARTRRSSIRWRAVGWSWRRRS